jgi:hypothetical protein
LGAHRALPGLAAWCALSLVSGGLSGQVTVVPVQSLSFGQVLPAVPEVVTPSDAARSASLEIRGATSFTLDLVLPTGLVSTAGDVLPLTFGGADATMSWIGFNRPPKAFDPAAPQDVHVPKPAVGVAIDLGGTASPDPLQPPGDYAATVIVIVSNAGN